MPVSSNSSAEPCGSSQASPCRAQDAGWTLRLSEVGGPLLQPSPRGFGLREHPAPDLGTQPTSLSCLGTRGCQESQQWDGRLLPASRKSEQGCRGWDGTGRDGPPTPQPGLGRDAPAPQRPCRCHIPQGRSSWALLAVPGETFAPESRRGGSDLVHPAPQETPRRLLIGL